MGLATNWQPPLHLQVELSVCLLQASTTKPGIFHQANLEHQQQTGRLRETKHGWRGNA